MPTEHRSQVEKAEGAGTQCPIQKVCSMSFACSPEGRQMGVTLDGMDRFQRGTLLFRDYGDGQPALVLQSGLAAAVSYFPDGETMVWALYGPGVAIGVIGALSRVTRPYVVRTLTEVTVCRLSIPRLAQQFEKEPQWVMRAIAHNMPANGWQLWIMNAQRVKERLRRLLIVLANLVEYGGLDVVVPVAQSDLAFVIRTDPATVSTCLRRLQDEGFLRLGYRKVTVVGSCSLDEAALNFRLTPLNLDAPATV